MGDESTDLVRDVSGHLETASADQSLWLRSTICLSQFLTAFWSTMVPVAPVTANRRTGTTPAARLSFTFTV